MYPFPLGHAPPLVILMTFRVIDRIEECFDGKRIDRSLGGITHIVVHRLGTSLGTTAREVAAAFRDTSNHWSAGSYTGGQVPYSLFIGQNGDIEQLLELKDIGWHARRWSRPGIGIAVSGDFRTDEHPTPQQWESLVSVCAILGYWIRVYHLCGHDELPRASADPYKRCPGKNLNMDDLRDQVENRIREVTVDLDHAGRDLVLASYGMTL